MMDVATSFESRNYLDCLFRGSTSGCLHVRVHEAGPEVWEEGGILHVRQVAPFGTPRLAALHV